MTNVRYRERGSDRELETAKFHTAERVNEREREGRRESGRDAKRIFTEEHRLVVSVTRKSNTRISKHENTIPGARSSLKGNPAVE